MNRNQKIGIGCGAAGCLGLIVICIAAGIFIYWRSLQTRTPYRANRNFNFNTNSNRNTNSNTNTNDDSNDNDSESASSSSDSSSYSDDDKHKLFQAAGMAGDAELLQRVMRKTGLFKANGTPSAEYEQFVKDHFSWAIENRDFVNSINTPEKARAYIEAHL
jgi:hypothetical protein